MNWRGKEKIDSDIAGFHGYRSNGTVGLIDKHLTVINTGHRRQQSLSFPNTKLNMHYMDMNMSLNL